MGDVDAATPRGADKEARGFRGDTDSDSRPCSAGSDDVRRVVTVVTAITVVNHDSGWTRCRLGKSAYATPAGHGLALPRHGGDPRPLVAGSRCLPVGCNHASTNTVEVG